MKRIRSDLALHRILDALEADLLAAPAEEIQAVAAETGMSAMTLLFDGGATLGLMKSASPLEGETGDVEHRRVRGMAQSSRRDRRGGGSTPHPDPGAKRPVCASQPAASGGGSDLPLKGGGS
jgi:hypothetical protein